MSLRVFIVRHGETEWSRSGQHTGLTDLALTSQGEEEARDVGMRLRGLEFSSVLVSPLQRAQQTCELANLGYQARHESDLIEWDNGEYEGLTTANILRTRLGWDLFRDGCPGGRCLTKSPSVPID